MKLSKQILVLAGCLALAGCGSVIDREPTQKHLKKELKRSLAAKIKKVSCPEDIKVEAKARFKCKVTTGEIPLNVIVEIKNDDADLDIVGIEKFPR